MAEDILEAPDTEDENGENNFHSLPATDEGTLDDGQDNGDIAHKVGQPHVVETTNGIVIEQPQISSTHFTESPNDSAVVVPSSSSRKRNKRNKIRKKWRRIVCRSFVVAAVALYAFLYMTLSSNPSVLLEEFTSSFSSSEVEEEYDDKNITGRPRRRRTIYERQLPQIRKVASSMARIYPPVLPLNWCVDERLSLDQLKRRPMGLCYLRIPGAASATLKGINMRIATNFAKRNGIKSCIRHDTRDFGMYYPLRDELSYLWTFLRDPTERAMSYVGSRLSQKYLYPSSRTDSNVNVTEMGLGQHALDLLQNSMDIRDGVLSEGRGGFQLQFAMQKYIPAWSAVDPLDPSQITKRPAIHRYVSQVFKQYDFIGIVERFDESLVVMQLLLGLETKDILYFATNTRTQWKRARLGRGNFVCRKSFDWKEDVLPQIAEKKSEENANEKGMNTTNTMSMSTNNSNTTATTFSIEEYLSYDREWFAQNYADYLFYQAANQSLDHTILKIGLDVYTKALKDFRQQLQLANEQCLPQFQCSDSGHDQSENSEMDCLDPGGNIGCGNECLNSLWSSTVDQAETGQTTDSN